MMKSLIAAALLAATTTAASSAVTISLAAGAGTSLANIHVGQKFTIDLIASGPSGEFAENAFGNFGNISNNVAYNSYAIDPTFSNDLSTNPILFDFTFTATAAGAANVQVVGVEVDTNVATYTALTTNLPFTVLPAAVPEPASWALMVGGFGMIGGAMRSRRKPAITFA